MGRDRFNEAAGFTRRKPRRVTWRCRAPSCRFNEAAGFTRRKLMPPVRASPSSGSRFNEAAGFTRRKHPTTGSCSPRRPRRFNEAAGFTRRKPGAATRPPYPSRASMRPPDLPGGNIRAWDALGKGWRHASMRPPDLPGGNGCTPQHRPTPARRFNEAAGFTRRKRRSAG